MQWSCRTICRALPTSAGAPGFAGAIEGAALAKTSSGPFFEFTVENVQARSYPLWGDQLSGVSVKPGEKMAPRAAEFVRFVLSREGQQLIMEDGKYFPLPANAGEGAAGKTG